MSSQDVITIENDFTLIRFQNDSDKTVVIERQVDI